MFGDKETANQLLRRFFYRKQLPGEPIASFSHGLIDIADRPQRLEQKTSAERDVMLRDQFVENVRDVHLRRDMKRRIEEDVAVSFLALRKVALRWFDEVEGATTNMVKAQVSEARAEPEHAARVHQTMGRSRRKQEAADTSAGTAERATDDVYWSAIKCACHAATTFRPGPMSTVRRPGVLPVPPEGTHQTPLSND